MFSFIHFNITCKYDFLWACVNTSNKNHLMSLPALYETNPSITGTNRLHVSTQRQKEVHVEHLWIYKKVQIMKQKKESETEIIKCLQLNNSLNWHIC